MSSETKEVKDFFHGYASDFDSIYGHEEKRGFLGKWIDRNTRQTMFKRFEKTLEHTASPEIKSVMDVGCGGGRYVVEFLKQGKEVLGLDLAQGMLDIAEKRVAEFGFENPKVEWVFSGYMEYEPTKKYDAACMMGFFDYIADPLPLLKKLERDIDKEIYGSFPKSEHWLAGQRRIRYKMRNCPLYLYSRKDLEKLLKDAGWEGKYEIHDFTRDLFVRVDFTK